MYLLFVSVHGRGRVCVNGARERLPVPFPGSLPELLVAFPLLTVVCVFK